MIIAANFDKINPYAKFGLIIGSGSFTEIANSKSGADMEKITSKSDGGTPIGLKAGVGLNYNINKNIAVFGEFNLINMTYAPTTKTRTEYTKNGVDQLPTTPLYFTQTNYSNDYDDSQTVNEPRKDVKNYFPFGSLSINIGIRYNLNKK